MTQEEIDALLVEIDMPRTADVKLDSNGGAKFSMLFADPSKPGQVAQIFGFIMGAPTPDALRPLPAMARKTIEAQTQKGLVPYYSIASNRAAA